MFLSRLTLNPRNAQVRSEIARPYEMHRTILQAFRQGKFVVSRDENDAAGVLFRVDEQPREQKIIVLVQSKIVPDWSGFDSKRDARGHAYLPSPPEMKSFDPLARLAAGQTFAFRLRANPTKRLGKGAGEDHHKRVGIYEEEKQLEWLRRKAENGGFRVVRAMITHNEQIENENAIHRRDQDHALKLLSVQFDGVLQVLNANTLCKSIECGIGSGKGFGFGLLSLAPA